MKRDMELVRQIAFKMEEWSRDTMTDGLQIAGYPEELVGLHCEYMHDEKLFEGFSTECSDSPYPTFGFLRLTPKGHDFIDTARSDNVWDKTIATAKEKGIGLTIDLAMQLLKATTKSMLGI